MAGSLVASMLLTDAYGGVGGIAKFNRDFLEALNACESIQRVRVLPRLISEPISSMQIPEAVIYDRKAARGKLPYARRLGRHISGLSATDLVICGHLNLLPIAWLMAKISHARLALVIHGIEAWAPPKSELRRRLASKADSVISVSKLTAERFCAWSGVDIRRAYILPNCVDFKRFVPQSRDQSLVERYGLQGSRVILTTGRLAAKERYKGFDEVIDMLPRLIESVPDLKYVIVGDGSDRRRLESRVKEMGVSDRVIFTGYIPESEKVAHYSLADVYVMPSSGEGFGIVLIEAAACGVPVVGSSVDGSREALLGGKLGRLVDPKQPQELVNAVIKVLGTRGQRDRPDGLETFGICQFRRRLADWINDQVDLISATT
jgi:phosphatidyl-myo-inositol dimannoside synthase